MRWQENVTLLMQIRKLARGLWILPVVLTLATGCGSTGAKPGSGETVPPYKKKHTVVYEITGRGKVDIAYQSDKGKVEKSKMSLPWRKKVIVKGDDPLTLSGVIPGFEAPSEPFTCTIERDGKQVAKKSDHLSVSCFWSDADA
ncbi:hypothetical protein [Streptomyces sp. WMMB 322]|uniref:hypothetical protein n=1 Tax=Streptomyces sp. WMMB 322 TaxID=1286821 RepID=UPI0008238A35|nr:hypothetical protein [Streptomyces sp. WMMB 322]SCK09588.1 hypothetical protein H180DRAFT_00479 [Streptomyces sp. WMMB 322]